jgi:pilus assembly protein CpaB
MKPKTIILMVVAIGCGLAASYMTSKLLADRSNKDTPAATVQVLVAKKKVPAFEPIKKPEDYFDVKEVPEGTYPAKCLKSYDDIRGQRLGKAKSEEETVFKDDILTQAQQGIFANMPEGARAIAIRVNPESLAGGFVLPGSRVDMIGTLATNTGEISAETIMQNMLVLAVDQQFNRDDRNAMLASTVTFALTPEEAQRLSVATRTTDIRLVLRGLNDKEKVQLPPSKTLDWRKPSSDLSKGPGDGSEGGPDGLPGVPGSFRKNAEVLTVLPKKDDGEAEVVKVEPPPPVTKHVMTITNGEYEQKAVFVKNENGEWARGGDSGDDTPPSHAKPTQPVPPPVQVIPTDDKTKAGK